MQKQTLDLTSPPNIPLQFSTFSFNPPATPAKRSNSPLPSRLHACSANLSSSKYTSNLTAFYHHHYYPQTKPPSSSAWITVLASTLTSCFYPILTFPTLVSAPHRPVSSPPDTSSDSLLRTVPPISPVVKMEVFIMALQALPIWSSTIISDIISLLLPSLLAVASLLFLQKPASGPFHLLILPSRMLTLQLSVWLTPHPV